jgi:hypothetical protein
MTFVTSSSCLLSLPPQGTKAKRLPLTVQPGNRRGTDTRFLTPCSGRKERQKNFAPLFYSNKNSPIARLVGGLIPVARARMIYINPPLCSCRNFSRSRYFIHADLYPRCCTFSIKSTKEQENEKRAAVFIKSITKVTCEP